MASFNSLVTVFGVLCLILSRNSLGAAQGETPDAAVPVIPQDTTTPNAPNPPEAGEPKVVNPSVVPTIKPETIPNPEPTPKAEPNPNPETTPKPEPEPKAEPTTKPEPNSREGPEPTPGKDNPKSNTQVGNNDQKEGKAGAATLYTNCGLFVLVGAMLLRL